MDTRMKRYDDLWNTLLPIVTRDMTSADRSQSESKLEALLSDWLREAGDDDTAADTLDILRQDFLAKIQGKSAAERLQVLTIETLDRRVRALGRDSFALGTRVIDGAIARNQARARGQDLMHQADTLAEEVRAVGDPSATEPLRRELEEISLEALYAIEQKAMSHRLSRYAQQGQNRSAPSVHTP